LRCADASAKRKPESDPIKIDEERGAIIVVVACAGGPASWGEINEL